MACFSPMVRRASSSVVPLAIRSSRSLRTFHGVAAVSNIDGNQKGGGSRRVLQFSTEAKAAKVECPRGGEENVQPVFNRIVSEKNLTRAINRIVSGTDGKSTNVEMAAAPEELSTLKVIDDPDDSNVYFKWEYRDEIIKVNVKTYAYDLADGYQYFDVTVTKRGCEVQLKFFIMARADKLYIIRLSLNKVMEDGSGSEEEVDENYVSPHYDDSSHYGPGNVSEMVDENVLKDLLYYLEVRGIKRSTTKFFSDHIKNRHWERIDKDWLKNLKRFFEY